MKRLQKKLAKETNSVVAATGKVDIVTDGKKIEKITAGHELMSKVVGTGCMATSIIGCFTAVEKDYLRAATEALTTFGKAAEEAAKSAKGAMDFKAKLFDAVAGFE